jgi:hypothetical protein
MCNEPSLLLLSDLIFRKRMIILNQFLILSRKENMVLDDQVTQDKEREKWVLYIAIKRECKRRGNHEKKSSLQ